MKLCNFKAGIDHPLFLIAGPCVIESRQMALDTAGKLKEICSELAISEANCWVIMHRARMRLRICLENNLVGNNFLEAEQ